MALKIFVTTAGSFIGFEAADNAIAEPLQLGIAPDGKVAFIHCKFCPNADKINLNPQQIVFTADPDQEMMDAYEQSQKNLSAARAGIVLAHKNEKLLKFTRN